MPQATMLVQKAEGHDTCCYHPHKRSKHMPSSILPCMPPFVQAKRTDKSDKYVGRVDLWEDKERVARWETQPCAEAEEAARLVDV
jgi:hypothetical protein